MSDKWIVMVRHKCDIGWHLINACGLVDTKEEALAHVELEKEHDKHWNEEEVLGPAMYKIARVTEFQEAV